MRKVVAGLFITLDGVVESPDKWQEHFDEDMGEAMMEQLASQDAVLLGRVTYQEWASYWPSATDEPFASFINSTPKYVFSTTLDSVEEWQNSTLIKGDLAQEIAKGSRLNKLNRRGRRLWKNGIVPFAMKSIPEQMECSQFFVSDFQTSRIGLAILDSRHR